MRRALVLCVVLLAALVPAASGQSSTPLRLWLSPQHTSVNDQDSNCMNEAFTYPMAFAAPASGLAAMGGSAGATPCITRFVFNATSPVPVQGTIRIHLLIKCDAGAVAASPSASFPQMRLVLLLNEKTLSNNATIVAADTCTNGASKTYDAQATIANLTLINVRDQLTLRAVSGWVNPPSSTGKGMGVVTGASGSYLDLPVPIPLSTAAPTSTAMVNPHASHMMNATGNMTHPANHTGHAHEGEALEHTHDGGGLPTVSALGLVVASMAVVLVLRRGRK